MKSTGYHLVEPSAYGKLLEGAGFVDVVVEDATEKFIDIMKREAGRLASNPEDFVGMFSESDSQVPDRPLEHEGRLLPRGRYEVGHFPVRRPG